MWLLPRGHHLESGIWVYQLRSFGEAARIQSAYAAGSWRCRVWPTAAARRRALNRICCTTSSEEGQIFRCGRRDRASDELQNNPVGAQYPARPLGELRAFL